jgi:hypothetical protein
MKLPIDASSLSFRCALSSKAMTDGETNRSQADGQGRSLYSVPLVVFGLDRAQVLAVNVVDESAPRVRQGTS